MSVLIKGMEMPKGFADVRIYADGRVISRTFLSFGEEIATAVPVPPHGRLIDADKLGFDMMDAANADQALAMVDDAPTIVEAEEGE